MIRAGGLVALLLAALVSTAAAEPALPLPIAVGGECRLMVSCPWSGPLGAHFRLHLLVWLPQDGDPRPRSVLPFAALSASLWRWAEAGATFGARGGATTDGSPAFLQLPIKIWARVSPFAPAEGLGVAAEVRYDVGRAPFDAAGTVYGDTESYALLVGYRKAAVDANISLTYQEAGARSYRGLEAGGALWLHVFRPMGLQLGLEAIGRFGSPAERTGLQPTWTVAFGVRSADDTGVSGGPSYLFGGGPGVPAHGPLLTFGLSFGPEYRLPAPSLEPLLPMMERWMGERLRRLGARPHVDPAVAPPGLYMAPEELADLPSYCTMPAAALPYQALRGCTLGPGARLRGPRLPTAGPELAAGTPPQRGIAGPPRGSRGAPRGRLRYGRGTGYEDAEPPGAAEVPPTYWTAGRPPGSASVRAEGEPPPLPAIPVEDIRPEVPPSMRAADLPPALRPRGGARGAAIDAAMPVAPASESGTKFSRGGRREVLQLAPRATASGQVICAECGVATPKPEVDHMQAKSRGGKGTITNGEALCPECNRAKSNNDVVPWKKNPVDAKIY